MRASIRILLVCSLAAGLPVLVLGGAQPAGATTYAMAYGGLVTRVSEFGLNLTAGSTTTFQTSSLAPNTSDPVMHLLNASGTQVAVNDNMTTSTKNSRIIFHPTTTGWYRLILRSKSQSTAGAATILKNGSTFLSNAPFGGWHISVPSLRVGETLSTVKLPGGATSPHLLYVLASNGISMSKWQGNNGIAGGATFKATSGPRTPHVVVAVSSGNPGRARLIRNDAALSGHDPDHDGVGTELESSIGTCSSLSGIAGGNFECSRALDPRDTDGDGISDGWEVLGRGGVTPNQSLPLWGANPRHKDLFMEVDFMRRTAAENSAGTDAKMMDTVSRKFASIYADAGTTDPLLRLYDARVLVNPDDEPGISLHLDTGSTPTSAADATTFGNWGGHNAVNAVCDASGCVGANIGTAWQTNLAIARRGIFRYTLATRGSGGSAGEGFALGYGMDDAYTAAHETGHSMGLDHDGSLGAPPYLKANCRPNYPSLMSYAYRADPFGFSNGVGRAGLNGASLVETNVVPASDTKYLDDLENRFGYNVDRTAGSVDWNRDGVFAPAGTTVRAYQNFTPTSSGGCENTRHHQQHIGNSATQGSPALVRAFGRLYSFSAPLGAVKYAYSTSAFNCKLPDESLCGTWTSPTTILDMSALRGIDAVRVWTGTQEMLLLVGVSNAGAIQYQMMSLQNGVEYWSGVGAIAGTSAGEPALAISNDSGLAYLSYRGTDGVIHWNTFTTVGGWSGDRVAQDATRTPIQAGEFADPGLSRAILTSVSPGYQMYGAFPSTDDRLDLYRLNTSTGLWEKTALMPSRPGPVERRPAMAWVPFPREVGSLGRLYLMYASHNAGSPDQRLLRMLMSNTKITPTGSVETIGLDADFDNVWFYGYGLDLWYDQGWDYNLRAAVTIGIDYGGSDPNQPKRYQVWFRPNADGIYDYTFVNHDDWLTLRYGLCKYVVDPANTIPDSSQINCPTERW
jgi:hypothetical protein